MLRKKQKLPFEGRISSGLAFARASVMGLGDDDDGEEEEHGEEGEPEAWAAFRANVESKRRSKLSSTRKSGSSGREEEGAEGRRETEPSGKARVLAMVKRDPVPSEFWAPGFAKEQKRTGPGNMEGADWAFVTSLPVYACPLLGSFSIRCVSSWRLAPAERWEQWRGDSGVEDGRQVVARVLAVFATKRGAD